MFSEGVKHPVIIPKQLLSVFPQSAAEQKDPQGIHFHFIIQVLFTQIVLINVWVTLIQYCAGLTVFNRSQWSWHRYHTYCLYRGDSACIPL